MAVAAAITAAAERLPKRKYPIRFTLKFLVTLLAGDCAASSFALLTKVRGNLSEFLVTNFNAHLLPALGVIRNLQRVVVPCVICPWSPLASTGKPSTRTTQKKRKERKGAKEAQKLCGKTFAATINFSHVASGLRRQWRQRRQFPNNRGKKWNAIRYRCCLHLKANTVAVKLNATPPPILCPVPFCWLRGQN